MPSTASNIDWQHSILLMEDYLQELRWVGESTRRSHYTRARSDSRFIYKFVPEGRTELMRLVAKSYRKDEPDLGTSILNGCIRAIGGPKRAADRFKLDADALRRAGVEDEIFSPDLMRTLVVCLLRPSISRKRKSSAHAAGIAS